MTLTYQVEEYAICRQEIDDCLYEHWQEIALDRTSVQLDKDDAGYQILADMGALHILTVRKDGVLAGYIAGVVQTHLHYKSTLHCMTDLYWIRPDCRKGRIGIELFKEYEKSLKSRGVKKIFIASKCHADLSKIFERLAWTRTEVVYTKVI